MAAAAFLLLAPAAVQAGDGDVVVTTISLKEFKQTFELYAIRKLVDSKPDDGVSFMLNKRDDQGNRIDWSDPGHRSVNVQNSFIAFKVEDATAAHTGSHAASAFESVMGVLGRKRPDSALRSVSCGLSGSEGVDQVACGKGPSVSPS